MDMPQPPETTTGYRICPLCEACCGLEFKVSSGRVVRIRGHDADVLSAGYLCAKGAALKGLHEDPERLRAPRIRRNGRLVEATWDEAFAEIERRLPPIMKSHGRDAVAVYKGNPWAHKMGLLLYTPRLITALGTRNQYSALTLDGMPKLLASGLMFGSWLSIAVPDIERSDLVVIIGANPAVSNGSIWTIPDFRGKAKALKRRGGKIVVVDPRRTETADLADQHLFIRPGGDVFLLLGLVHTLFDEGAVRLNRLANHVAGLDALKAAVMQFPAERVAARCNIDAPSIRELARTIASAKRAAVYGRLGTCAQEYGTLASWLVDVLNVLTGHLDEPGGAMFPKAAALAANTLGPPGTGEGIVTGRYRTRVSGAPEIKGEFPAGCLAEEIDTPGEGQIKALITIAGNPVLSIPDSARLSTALKRLEFMLSLDIYVNETTRHADVILPGLSPLEEQDYEFAHHQLAHRNVARYGAAVLPAPAGQPPEWQILLRLAGLVEGGDAEEDVAALDDRTAADMARALAGPHSESALEAVSSWRGPDRLLDLALRTGPYGDGFGTTPDGLTLEKLKALPQGIDLGPLSPRIPELLRTPSGKIELAPSMLLDDLRRVEADLRRPVEEMVIVGRRDVRSNNTWMHNLPTLAKGKPRCTARVHPVDAERLRLTPGTKGRITSATGSVEVNVVISDEMMPGVVSLPHGWGHDLPGAQLSVAAAQPGANLNTLLAGLRDPLSGTSVLSGGPVRLESVDD